MVSVVFLISAKALAIDDLKYLVFDKVLSGTTSCFDKSISPWNFMCSLDEMHFILSGWVRVGQDGLPSDVGDSSVFMELDSVFYDRGRSYGLEDVSVSYCRKAITLVKSNPSKWDLKIGIQDGWSNTIRYCEAINQSLMKQYYAEQE